MPTPDVTHRAGTLQRRPCLFNFLPIGPGAQRGLLWGQTETDDLFGIVGEQLGIGLLDKRMPMPQPDVDLILLATGLIQSSLELLRHILGDPDRRGLSARCPIPFANLFDEFRRRGTATSHIQQERLHILQTIRPTHGHEENGGRALRFRHHFTGADSLWLVANGHVNDASSVSSPYHQLYAISS